MPRASRRGGASARAADPPRRARLRSSALGAENTRARAARKTAIRPALFLVAIASYPAGSELIASAPAAPDRHADLSATGVRLGVLLELVDAPAAVGIAVVVFPIRRARRERAALGRLALPLG